MEQNKPSPKKQKRCLLHYNNNWIDYITHPRVVNEIHAAHHAARAASAAPTQQPESLDDDPSGGYPPPQYDQHHNLDGRIREAQQAVAELIEPFFDEDRIKHHPRKDDLMREFPGAFVSMAEPALASDGVSSIYPDFTLSTAGAPTSMYFRHLRHRMSRMEQRLKMHMCLMFRYLLHEINKQPHHGHAAWNNDSTWTIGK